MTNSVVTRFAPSPTGFLHIGGARTALFNWLYAHHTGGSFLIRIEDTDKARSTEAAVAAIFEGLDWLGLKSDAEIVYQSKREERHREVVAKMLCSGTAYRCYMTPEETEVAREAARAGHHALRSSWRDNPDTAQPQDKPHVIRFKGPLEGDVLIDDAVQGLVRFDARDLDDLVLARSDGSPTYNLAVVVDDHDMGVTHIIRGDDHLNNAARQSLIYRALGWTCPVFAHIPLIHGPDGAKLSKRHGAQALGDYQALGYLPEAMRNYLSRLGWSHGDDEIYDDAAAIAWFDIFDINKAPARLDFAKLGHVNAQWLRRCAPERLVALTRTFLDGELGLEHHKVDEILARGLPLIRERAQTLIELAQAVSFALVLDLPRPDVKQMALLSEENRARLSRFVQLIAFTDFTSVNSAERVLKTFVESEGIGFGKFGPILRLALSAGKAAPDMATTLFVLGESESLRRINHTLLIS